MDLIFKGILLWIHHLFTGVILISTILGYLYIFYSKVIYLSVGPVVVYFRTFGDFGNFEVFNHFLFNERLLCSFLSMGARNKALAIARALFLVLWLVRSRSLARTKIKLALYFLTASLAHARSNRKSLALATRARKTRALARK